MPHSSMTLPALSGREFSRLMKVLSRYSKRRALDARLFSRAVRFAKQQPLIGPLAA